MTFLNGTGIRLNPLNQTNTMKKLNIIILAAHVGLVAALVGLASCTPTPPIRVSHVINRNPTQSTKAALTYDRYRVIATGSNGEQFIFYTDSLYQVGDTIIAK